MKLTLQHVNIRSTHPLDCMVEERILGLEERMRVEEARVRLEHHGHESPAFRASLYIVTPGPDLEVEARDHTIRAAFDKAMAVLLDKLRWRTGKPLRRIRSNLQERPREHRRSAFSTGV